MALSTGDKINHLRDAHTFQELSTKVGALYDDATAGNPAGLTMATKFNSIKDAVTVEALTAFIKDQSAAPSASGKLHAAPVATDPTNGSRDVMTVGEVVRFIMLDQELPPEPIE